MTYYMTVISFANISVQVISILINIELSNIFIYILNEDDSFKLADDFINWLASRGDTIDINHFSKKQRSE
jgi:hypothetical protein